MSKTNRRCNDYKGRRRHISVRAVQREAPDIRRLGRAIVSLALAEAEAEAQAQAAEAAAKVSEGSDKPDTSDAPEDPDD